MNNLSETSKNTFKEKMPDRIEGIVKNIGQGISLQHKNNVITRVYTFNRYKVKNCVEQQY